MSIKKPKRNHNKPDLHSRNNRSQSSDNFSFYRKIIDFFIIKAGQSTTRTELIQKFANDEPVKIKKLLNSNPKKDLNFIFYGHTHKPALEKSLSTIIANPGNIASIHYPASFAILNTTTKKLELKILTNL